MNITPDIPLSEEIKIKIREAYGTEQLFKRRADILRRLLRLVAFFGILGPVVIGAVVTSFSNYQSLMPILIPIAGAVGIAQLVVTLWSLVNKWDDSYAYALRSQDGNADLLRKWEALGKTLVSAPSQASAPAFIDSYNRVSEIQAEQSKEDKKQGVTDKETRRGMREALFKFRQKCLVCCIMPTSRKAGPSKCNCCGNF